LSANSNFVFSGRTLQYNHIVGARKARDGDEQSDFIESA